MHFQLAMLFIAISISLCTLHTGSTQAALNGANLTQLNGKYGFAQLNGSVHNLQEQVQYLSTQVDERVELAKQEILSNLTQSLAPFLTLIQKLDHQNQLTFGRIMDNPAQSCREIKDNTSNSTSDFYWIIGTSGPPVLMYCDMTRTCGGMAGPWMLVTKIKMNNLEHSCPIGLSTLTDTRRRCAMPSDTAGCASATFSVHNIPYQGVCGRIIGYQYGSLDAFRPYILNRQLTIDDAYVDGVSLTHGRDPRKHLWTFAAAIDEPRMARMCSCNTSSSWVPPYVANNYFCDTGSIGAYEHGRFYSENYIWNQCNAGSHCCNFNNLPWFSRHLSYTTSDDIELRVCRNEARGNEDVSLRVVHLYIQ